MDFQCVDTDMEISTPETKYFKMMMEDNETGRITSNENADEDSIVGGQTIASLMDDVDHSSGIRDSDIVENVSRLNDVEESIMSIVGVDDVSTIANDTANEITNAFFTGNADRKDSKPRIRLFKEYSNEYKTPEKKKRSNQTDGDDHTQPETPPGMIQVPSSNRSNSFNNRHEGKLISEDGKPFLLRSKRVHIVALVLALILFVSIIALAVALEGVRDRESSTIPPTVDSPPNNVGNEFLDIWPDLGTNVNNNDDDPIIVDPVKQEPVLETPQPTSGFQTSAPTAGPSADLFSQFTFDEVLDLLIERGVLFEGKDVDINPDSVQYYATAWISQDPNFYDYTQDRVIQRWALAILAKSLDLNSGLENPSKRRKLQIQHSDLVGWLSYADECSWFTSSKEEPCDQDGMYQIIDLHNMSLRGTLPSELAMLSNSLQIINLDRNELTGSIPKELEGLTNLVSLRLRKNNLEEDLSIDFGKLKRLRILDLGENDLTGYVPYNILYLNSPTEIYLDSNKFIGNIPWSIGDLSTLKILSLGDNYLTGWVPESLADLVNLETLTLENNQLKGRLPNDICLFEKLEILSVDCAEQGCECCTECATANPPSSTPTDLTTFFASAAPSTSPTVTPPARQLTHLPSKSPIECVDKISVLDFCFAPSAHVGVSFTNCDSKRDDWVGIYRVSDTFDKDSMASPEMWSWTCGTRNCREAVTQKIIPLNDIHAEDGKWPLDSGIYVAVLARNTATPYMAYAVSDTFVVATQC